MLAACSALAANSAPTARTRLRTQLHSHTEGAANTPTTTHTSAAARRSPEAMALTKKVVAAPKAKPNAA